MCGRYASLEGTERAAYRAMVAAARNPPAAKRTSIGEAARFDIRPTQEAPVLFGDGLGVDLSAATWGWRRDFAGGGQLINARWETAATKPTFAEAVRRRRCVVPATAYYEWRRDARDRPLEKYAFRARDGGVLLMAGLYDEDPPGSGQRRFLVLTRPMLKHAAIHDRTPVMLSAAAARAWVDPAMPEGAIRAAAASLGDDDLVVRPVVSGPNRQCPAGPRLLESTAEPWPAWPASG